MLSGDKRVAGRRANAPGRGPNPKEVRSKDRQTEAATHDDAGDAEGVLYIVKTDSPSKGKGVHVHTDLESALEDVRFYLLHDTPVRVLVDRHDGCAVCHPDQSAAAEAPA